MSRKKTKRKRPEQLELSPTIGSKFDNVKCELCDRDTPRRFGPRCGHCKHIIVKD